MGSSDIKSAFIRQDFLMRCLICGKTRNTNDMPFRNLGNESGNAMEKHLANLVKNYVGLVVNQALCCRSCFLTLNHLEGKTKLLRDRCKRTVKSITSFVTSDVDEDHNYYVGSDDKFIGTLRSEDYENILPAEIIISNTSLHLIQDSFIQVEEKADVSKKSHKCMKCNASFTTQYFLRKHLVVHNQEERIEEIDLVPKKVKANIAENRKNCHMSLRKNPRRSVKSKFSDLNSRNSDGSPAKISKIAHQSTTRSLGRKSSHKVDSLQNVSDTEENTTEAITETSVSELSPDKSLVEPVLKPRRNATLFKCGHCPATFTSSLRCSEHKEMHENLYWENANDNIMVKGGTAEFESVLPVDNGKQFQCKICAMEFSTGKESFRHMKKVHSDKSCCYKCKICSKMFAGMTNLRAHLHRHSANKPFKCPCGKTFTFSEALIRHAKIHTRGQKSNLCQFCGKLFTTKDTLDYHTRSIHLNAVLKDHICDVCGKAFDRKSKLDVHKRVHSKEKGFLCDSCGQQYKDPSVLNQHRKFCGIAKTDGMVEDDSIKSIPCKACLKTFPSLSSLTDHITVAHEKECIGCGVSITSYRAWRAHKDFCSKIAKTKSVFVSHHLRSSILEQTIDPVNKKKVADSSVIPTDTDQVKLSKCLAVQTTGDQQTHGRVNTNKTSYPDGNHGETGSSPALAGGPQVSEANHSEIVRDSDHMDSRNVTTSLVETSKCLDNLQDLPSANSHFVVVENGSPVNKETIEDANLPYPTEAGINQQIPKESVEFHLGSNIFTTEPDTGLTSFVNSSSIFHALGSGHHLENVNSLDTGAQETIYVVLENGTYATEVQQKVQYIQQIIPSTELENVTAIDPDLTAIEQDCTVEFLSQ